LDVLGEHASSLFRFEMNLVGKKRQFCMEEVLGKVGHGEEMDHLARAGEVKRRWSQGGPVRI
jgi:hypothetical protein